MAKKEDIFKAVNSLIILVDQSINEREEALRALCGACSVSNYDDIQDHELWNVGFNLDNQLDDLKGLKDDLQSKIKYIGAFKDVI